MLVQRSAILLVDHSPKDQNSGSQVTEISCAILAFGAALAAAAAAGHGLRYGVPGTSRETTARLHLANRVRRFRRQGKRERLDRSPAGRQGAR